MRAITTDIKTLVGRLGPVAVKALDQAVGLALRATHPEVTSDHLLRALLDLPDCDLSAAMAAANLSRVDLGARLDWHLKRLPSGHKGKPTLGQKLLLWIQDAAALTTDRVRTGHLAAALLADPSLSAAGVAEPLAALPREPRHLMASRLEDQGEVGRNLAPAAPPAPAKVEPAPTTITRPVAEAARPAPANKPADAPAGEKKAALGNEAALREALGDRLLSAGDGLLISARVAGRATTLRIDWDTDARVLVLRIAIPADPPKDEVGAAVALSTLNNALPHGAFVLEEGKLAFRSHVFLDARGNAPIEAVLYAAGVCEQAAEALADEG